MSKNLTELEKLYLELRELESYYTNQIQPFDSSMTYCYLMVKKKICILESMKYLSISAPRTLDPVKISNHLKMVLGFLSSLNTVQSPILTERIDMINKQFTVVYPYQEVPSKKPDNSVDFYVKEITQLMADFYTLWKQVLHQK